MAWDMFPLHFAPYICGQIVFLLILLYLMSDEKDKILSNLQIFNEFNARKPDEYNIFKGVTRNYLFMGIIGLTLVLQVSLVNTPLVVLSHCCEMCLRVT